MTHAHEPGIRLNGVTKSFGSKQVLTGIDLDLPAGRIYGLLGANGVGKTTLMSLICGHMFLSGGQIRIDGENPVENATVLQRTCFIREDQRYNDAFSAGQILRVVPHFYRDWSQEVADRLVRRFRLPLRTPSKKLSRGQRTALAATIALASRAEYTFLDEPYLGLDAAARGIFYEELVTEFAAFPRTVLLSTHLIDEIVDILEDVVILDQGTVAVHTDIETAGRSAYVVRGPEAPVQKFVAGRDVLTRRRVGSVAVATVRGTVGAADTDEAAQQHLTVAPAGLQDFVAALGIRSLDGDNPVDTGTLARDRHKEVA